MRKYLHILFLLLFLSASPCLAGFAVDGESTPAKVDGTTYSAVDGVEAPAVGCVDTGTWSDGGEDEGFEKGDAQFCTSGWTEVDTGGVIDLYDNGWNHTGSNSMKVTLDSDTVGYSEIWCF